MTASLISLGFISIGEILLAFTVITVHSHIIKERKIDRDVLRTMKSEQRIAFYGLILIIAGTLIEIMSTFY